MTLRIFLILAASAGTGAALGLATSIQEGFFGALSVATLLHEMIKSKPSEKKSTSGSESID